MTQTIKNIHVAINQIMAGCDGLTKDRTSNGGFKYRGIDDMYNYLHDQFVAAGVFSVPNVKGMAREERLSNAGKTLIYTLLTVEYTFYALDGSSVSATVVGEAFDSGDKSASKALAIAHKYALFQITMLPTMLSDPDAEQHDVAARVKDDVRGSTDSADAPPAPAKKIKMATAKQKKVLKDYRALGATTGEMNDYLDNKKTSLTHKQADQLIAKLDRTTTEESK